MLIIFFGGGRGLVLLSRLFRELPDLDLDNLPGDRGSK